MPNHAVVLLVLLIFLATSVLGELHSHPVAASAAAAAATKSTAPADFRFRANSKKPTAAWGPGTKAGNGAFYPPHTTKHAFSPTRGPSHMGVSQHSRVYPVTRFPWGSLASRAPGCGIPPRFPSNIEYTLTTKRARI